MIQIRSILDVADNTGAKKASYIGVLGRKGRSF
ncbi:MAG: uL14 family ribosomal protein, partial [Candidatus Omnitrophica bacterium]|nr:uL14 family ribosomal protein [Candidatus Omnitrophota bacterium]